MGELSPVVDKGTEVNGKDGGHGDVADKNEPQTREHVGGECLALGIPEDIDFVPLALESQSNILILS
jgi:hypothetical protein